ncbi:anti-sigma regulatory factor [Longimycelium tulufanense]|uniref:Anti-sigma regulatory factor n=1 Tax=Longimycelium tulufanense TaxID=907463 RepID=A0A8J3CKT2_9PSEU|nr:sensor histidine kinase [Longimycelium tulufanense]GGM78910.1 anti-sigma regulatory factor [Longimycelium tulufanense]
MVALGSPTRFRHEALLYRGEPEYVGVVQEFVRAGVAGGEPVLVAVPGRRLDLLRRVLGAVGERVRFVDMTGVGRNPGRIISVWYEFVREHTAGGRRVRGVGEPVWPGRSPEELVECQRSEALVNVAFGLVPAWWLLCPYDVVGLPAGVVSRACRHHPFVWRDGAHRAGGGVEVVDPLAGALPEPPGVAVGVAFTASELRRARHTVARVAREAGLPPARVDDLVLAMGEAAANSLRHGGGRGLVRVWRHRGSVVCEVRDAGRILDPLVGRLPPEPHRYSGRGLWLVHHLCDLVQVRSGPAGTVVRMRMEVPERGRMG